jgi:hypothetical protein
VKKGKMGMIVIEIEVVKFGKLAWIEELASKDIWWKVF